MCCFWAGKHAAFLEGANWYCSKAYTVLDGLSWIITDCSTQLVKKEILRKLNENGGCWRVASNPNIRSCWLVIQPLVVVTVVAEQLLQANPSGSVWKWTAFSFVPLGNQSAGARRARWGPKFSDKSLAILACLCHGIYLPKTLPHIFVRSLATQIKNSSSFSCMKRFSRFTVGLFIGQSLQPLPSDSVFSSVPLPLLRKSLNSPS